MNVLQVLWARIAGHAAKLLYLLVPSIVYKKQSNLRAGHWSHFCGVDRLSDVSWLLKPSAVRSSAVTTGLVWIWELSSRKDAASGWGTNGRRGSSADFLPMFLRCWCLPILLATPLVTESRMTYAFMTPPRFVIYFLRRACCRNRAAFKRTKWDLTRPLDRPNHSQRPPWASFTSWRRLSPWIGLLPAHVPWVSRNRRWRPYTRETPGGMIMFRRWMF